MVYFMENPIKIRENTNIFGSTHPYESEEVKSAPGFWVQQEGCAAGNLFEKKGLLKHQYDKKYEKVPVY